MIRATLTMMRNVQIVCAGIDSTRYRSRGFPASSCIGVATVSIWRIKGLILNKDRVYGSKPLPLLTSIASPSDSAASLAFVTLCSRRYLARFPPELESWCHIKQLGAVPSVLDGIESANAPLRTASWKGGVPAVPQGFCIAGYTILSGEDKTR